jgi:hypothetical protein
MLTKNVKASVEQFIENAEKIGLIEDVEYQNDVWYRNEFWFKNQRRDYPIELHIENNKFAIFRAATPVMYGRIDCTAEFKPIEHLNSKEFLNELEQKLNKMLKNECI